MRNMNIVLIVCGLLAACSHQPEPPAANMQTEPTSGSEMNTTPAPNSKMESQSSGVSPQLQTSEAQPMAVQPDTARLKAHIGEHIKYPATREDIIAACAQTNEFTPGEKEWIKETLPAGNYSSDDEVLRAMRITTSP